MNLKLLRFEGEIGISDQYVRTLEIENRELFARVVSSILSEKSLEAVEPYEIWGDNGKPIRGRKPLLILNSLPNLPYNDRSILTKLHALISRQADESSEMAQSLATLSNGLMTNIEDLSLGLFSDYEFGVGWGLEAFLKVFSFGLAYGDDFPFLDNCMRFLGLCADIRLNVPIVFVNAKSFLSDSELNQLFEHALFLGLPLLLIESWHDQSKHQGERKSTIDLHLIENL